MKTKQKLISLALAVILILALAACGAARKSAADETSYSSESSAAAPADAGGTTSFTDTQKIAETGTGTAELANTKKIYSGYAEIETLDFEKTLADLKQMITDCGGFVESSSETGGDYTSMYQGETIFRTADYTIRIPVENYDSVYNNGLKNLGNVVNNNSSAQDITMQYTDTESRLKTYRTEEERLLDMLSKATTVEDMLAIETRLSDVRYQIESLTSQIKVWDSLVSYSTLTLSIREVALYTKDNSSTISYGEQLKQTFSHSLYSLGSFFKGFFKFLVAVFPALVVLAIIAAPVFLIVRAANRKKKAKTPPPQNVNNNNDPSNRPPFQQ